MQRRILLSSLAGVLTLPLLSAKRVRAAVDEQDLDAIRTGWRELLAEGVEIAESTEPLQSVWPGTRLPGHGQSSDPHPMQRPHHGRGIGRCGMEDCLPLIGLDDILS